MSDFIPVNQAAKMNAFFRTNRELILKPEYQGQNILCICETFEKEQVADLLNKPGCEFFRIYYGMDDAMKVHAILCAVDENNADILYLQGETTAALENGNTDGFVVEMGQRCPEECPPPSVLNS
jgi:hypothetical protein